LVFGVRHAAWRFFLQLDHQINPRTGFMHGFDQAAAASFDQSRHFGMRAGNQMIPVLAMQHAHQSTVITDKGCKPLLLAGALHQLDGQL
jgi:hypothetical protein